jgi:hypothetical protein
MFGSKRVKQFFTLRTVADTLKDADLQAAYRTAALGLATTPPPPLVLTVGQVIESEFFASHIGISTEGGICKFTEYLLDRHGILIGEVGSGKTTAIQTLTQQVVRNTNRDVFVLNFKGQRNDDEALRKIIAQWRPNVKIIRLDPDNPGWPYNPFKYGDALSLSNRWMRAFGIERTIGRTDEWWGLLATSVILKLCHGGPEPPRSLEAFKARMNATWLRGAYPENHPELDEMEMLLKAEKGQPTPLERFQLRSQTPFKHLERFIKEDGWTPVEGSAIISVPASKIPETARAIAGVIVEDFKHFMSARQQRPCEILWDEFQAASNESITELLSQSRSFHCGVFLATQDINKLGDELQQKVLTSDTTTMIAFRTQQSAGFVAKMSGTVRKARITKQIVEGGVGVGGSVTEDEEYRIHPDDIAQLPDGYCYILKNRTYCKVKFNKAVIPDNVAPEPVYIPAPMPVSSPPPAEEPKKQTKKAKAKVNEME